MRVQTSKTAVHLWVDGATSYDWAHRPGATWPASALSGRMFRADFDANGLYAICADLLARHLSPDHPAYPVAVAQHLAD